VKPASGYGRRVELYVRGIDEPNAFAVGNVLKRAVVVHRGLIDVLDRDEVEAVIAHKVGHLKRNDNAYVLAASLTPYLTFIAGGFTLLLRIALAKSVK